MICKSLITVSLIHFMLISLNEASVSNPPKENKLLQLIQNRFQTKPSPRQMDFLTDPSLLVTILHSLEIAYWSLPMGFVLMPLINFFRVPNRRRSMEPASGRNFDSKDVAQFLARFNDVIRQTAPTSDNRRFAVSQPNVNSPLNSKLPLDLSEEYLNNYRRQIFANLKTNLAR